MNQVVEIILKFLESRDWKQSFFQVIPLRKRGEAGSEDNTEEGEGKDSYNEDDTEAGVDDEDGQRTVNGEEDSEEEADDQKAKRLCIDAEIKA